MPTIDVRGLLPYAAAPAHHKPQRTYRQSGGALRPRWRRHQMHAARVARDQAFTIPNPTSGMETIVQGHRVIVHPEFDSKSPEQRGTIPQRVPLAECAQIRLCDVADPLSGRRTSHRLP
jgi:hypothetical protein